MKLSKIIFEGTDILRNWQK